ncbi:hypothetical protein MM1S1540310_0050 [Mycobacteroides abscessus subsp. bolletii 1S-154-0310]|uniref:Uncharacterized protein n=4 Tax=Mycobacteroides abscessus TaxID=36809 RepID=A0A829MBI9_9MYCO|nr:hypothetical protein MA5S0421_5094 [Mycobacteroides abscessus 5S-0421]EIU09688.1 hypothetical protein MA5S0304_4860 [Mycobacteroides abscessus 5S-0304]EIU24603.1 hypothetical protein MA5S0817_4410 [Mycobacteroides abscessus 5S-0817]EIU49728.1 hypothetical protein MA5S1215_0175 [Mycobacteroides abscessus 5S-1215]EIU72437.1 hypothetical protein MM1S1520914_0703 [Mycobacteroides abscessus subsp. bolletii 1S-152-0914]EIU84324.1 hypothetical protein MM1S1540310_0050 [Mycobacteroides abscessus su
MDSAMLAALLAVFVLVGEYPGRRGLLQIPDLMKLTTAAFSSPVTCPVWLMV